MFIMITAVAILFAFIEYVRLKKSGHVREIVAGASLLGIGLILSAMRISGMKLPSAYLFIRIIEHSVDRFVFNLFS